jgi:hypothetical protein
MCGDNAKTMPDVFVIKINLTIHKVKIIIFVVVAS